MRGGTFFSQFSQFAGPWGWRDRCGMSYIFDSQLPRMSDDVNG
jgi:hypothetical protein